VPLQIPTCLIVLRTLYSYCPRLGNIYSVLSIVLLSLSQFYSVLFHSYCPFGSSHIYTVNNSTPTPADRQFHSYDYQGLLDCSVPYDRTVRTPRFITVEIYSPLAVGFLFLLCSGFHCCSNTMQTPVCNSVWELSQMVNVGVGR